MFVPFLLLVTGGALLFYAATQPVIWGSFVYPLQYREIIREEAQARNLDPNLVAAVIFEESRFNAGQQSRAGARGLMQILPSTAAAIAQELGDEGYDAKTLLEPDRNIRYGTHYLHYLVNKYQGDLDLALAAYNAGETNVDRWQKEGRRGLPFKETEEFVVEVKKSQEMYKTIYGNWYEKLEEGP